MGKWSLIILCRRVVYGGLYGRGRCVICCILIVTIPWGIASFRIANYVLWPFGRQVVQKPTAGAFSFLGNVIWFIFAGLWLAIGHVVSGVALAITIIGIPLAIADFKMIPISLAPLGKEIVSTGGTTIVAPQTT